MTDKKRWVLKHPDFEQYWGVNEVDDLETGWTILAGCQVIESKYKPTYLNFVGSNVQSKTKQMKKGEVIEI